MQMISNLYSRDGFPLPQVQSLRLSLLTLPSPFPSPSNPRYLYRTPPPPLIIELWNLFAGLASASFLAGPALCIARGIEDLCLGLMVDRG
jgi:hypothetical protein